MTAAANPAMWNLIVRREGYESLLYVHPKYQNTRNVHGFPSQYRDWWTRNLASPLLPFDFITGKSWPRDHELLVKGRRRQLHELVSADFTNWSLAASRSDSGKLNVLFLPHWWLDSDKNNINTANQSASKTTTLSRPFCGPLAPLHLQVKISPDGSGQSCRRVLEARWPRCRRPSGPSVEGCFGAVATVSETVRGAEARVLEGVGGAVARGSEARWPHGPCVEGCLEDVGGAVARLSKGVWGAVARWPGVSEDVGGPVARVSSRRRRRFAAPRSGLAGGGGGPAGRVALWTAQFSAESAPGRHRTPRREQRARTIAAHTPIHRRPGLERARTASPAGRTSVLILQRNTRGARASCEIVLPAVRQLITSGGGCLYFRERCQRKTIVKWCYLRRTSNKKLRLEDIWS